MDLSRCSPLLVVAIRLRSTVRARGGTKHTSSLPAAQSVILLSGPAPVLGHGSRYRSLGKHHPVPQPIRDPYMSMLVGVTL
ncbi:hypothetical protein NDU88_004345 [Pleurodeles waltl]|uniref:Secreted protein n=1 Tax=Pleurodeles waltl TaxID=8319 RepID=A0AAV7TT97_PLEWA|nr:hypothetical protein NDU88_004345 [Pleurodeles waltl]